MLLLAGGLLASSGVAGPAGTGTSERPSASSVTEHPPSSGNYAPDHRDAEGGRPEVVELRTSRSARRGRAVSAVPTPRPVPVTSRWVSPVLGGRVSSCYGPRWGTTHEGVDISAPYGTTIRAVGAGTVTQAGWRWSGYGYTVIVRHLDGWSTFYAHASTVSVRTDQRVAAGQVIGRVGATGRATGPHLHLGVARATEPNVVITSFTDPAPFLRIRGIAAGCG